METILNSDEIYTLILTFEIRLALDQKVKTVAPTPMASWAVFELPPQRLAAVGPKVEIGFYNFGRTSLAGTPSEPHASRCGPATGQSFLRMTLSTISHLRALLKDDALQEYDSGSQTR